MTIIVWDGKTLASDSQASMSGTIISTTTKKIYDLRETASCKLLGRLVIAMGTSGQSGSELEIIARMQSEEGVGPLTEFTEVSDFNVIVITVTSAFTISKEAGNKHAQIEEIYGQSCTGSGYVAGFALLSVGLSAVEVVKKVIELDVYCGGEVQFLTLCE